MGDERAGTYSKDASGTDALSTAGQEIAAVDDAAGVVPQEDRAETDLPESAADQATDATPPPVGETADRSAENSLGMDAAAQNRVTADAVGSAAESSIAATDPGEATTNSIDPGSDARSAAGGSSATDKTAADSSLVPEDDGAEEAVPHGDLDADGEEGTPWIELPEVDLAPIGRGRSDGSPMRQIIDHSAQLRGAWRQLDPSDNAPDFGPGGFDECMLGIDSASGVLQLYRSWGRPPEVVVAAHFLAEFAADGTLRLAADPQRPHLFSESPVTLGGATIEPPGEDLDLPRRWRLVASGELEIDGRRYARADRATFERLTRSAPLGARNASPIVSAPATSVRPVLAEERRAIDFFGTSVKGRRVCFVVDRSGSMSEGFKMQTALRELDRCIRSLPPDREFFVLFFDEGKLVVEDRWISADPATARLFLDRLPGVQTGGGTNPHDALVHAFGELAPVPDELHLMTDGLIPFGVVELLRELNSGAARTVVHTYAFTNREGEAILRQVADEHGGTYRFVP